MEINENKLFPSELPIIVEDELFLYPFMITPLFLSDDENLQALDFALNNETPVFIAPTKPQNDGERNFGAIYDAGVIGTIMRRVALPDGRVKILFQGRDKARIIEPTSKLPLKAIVDIIHVKRPTQAKTDALLAVLREKVRELSVFSHFFSSDLLKTVEESIEAVRVCDLVSSALRLKKQTAYNFFIEDDLEQRILKLIDYVIEEIEASKLQKEIKNKVHSKIDKTNKEYFLKEQLKQIQAELGTNNDRDEEIDEYYKKLEKKKKFMGEDAYKESKKQIDKLSRMHPDSADANTLQSYLDWVLEVPFENIAKKKSSIAEVSKHLNADHYSLEKPKERIQEYFALRELLELRGLNDKVNNGAILCFVGPPGVGKTSLANSIAKALKRELVRIALGGLEDVNELRGHRRTYIGAMPGRIVQGLIEAKQMNPVVVLDEIDKVGRSYRGDPTAVMLEILDPEQNNKFRDYYLNFNIDLSKIIFIATANEVSTIPPALRDRMEFIELSSYTPQEKFEIAKSFLVPQELEKHGLKNTDIRFNKDGLELIISDYTRESGVRNLRRRIADIMRKVAKNIISNKEQGKVVITAKNLKDFLEKKVYEIEPADKKDQIGQVNGLAWTSVGGDVLRVEAIRIQGKGAMQITGQLGDVMKESAQIAFSVAKVLIDKKKVKVPMSIVPKFDDDKRKLEASDVYRRYDLHLHVPEGATPKDGPSAGITMVTAIVSILSDTKVRHDVAMTGEITLSGRVLPIGGLKEKLIAAHKAGIKLALIPRKNYERDLDDIPDDVKKDMQIKAVDIIDDVLKMALVAK
ncbi:MAG: endopeptidase La [Campylobacter sp.]|nr:endopeptidase La [Campylobacter sp.]